VVDEVPVSEVVVDEVVAVAGTVEDDSAMAESAVGSPHEASTMTIPRNTTPRSTFQGSADLIDA
jgi:hypothetical protein